MNRFSLSIFLIIVLLSLFSVKAQTPNNIIKSESKINKITFMSDVDEYQRFKQFAEYYNRTISNFIENAALRFIAKEEYLNDFENDEIAENYINTTFIVLRKYVSLGELEDIRTELPKDLKSMVYHNMMF